MATTYKQGTRQMTVSTPLGPDKLLLVGFTGTERISGLYSFELELIAENATAVPFDKLLGQELAITMLIDDGSDAATGHTQRYFRGICSRFSQGDRDEIFTTYWAEIVPPFWLL